MSHRILAVLAAIGGGVLIAAALGGCGDDDRTTYTTISEAAAGTGDAELKGSVVVRDGVARLCEALLESFPPQCGEPSIEVTDVEVVDSRWTHAQGVSWTDLPVEVSGTVDAGVLTIRE